jgi:hypothetical protein
MASNSGDSSASALTSLLTGSQLHWLSILFTDSLTTDWLLNLSRLLHLSMECVENTVSNSFSIVACELIALETCLFCGCYLVMGLHAALLPPWGLCLWFLWSILPSFPGAQFSWRLLSNHSSSSLLKAARFERFPHKLSVGPSSLPLFFFQSVWAKLSKVAGASTSLALTLYAVSSFVWEGADPSTMSSHAFSTV